MYGSGQPYIYPTHLELARIIYTQCMYQCFLKSIYHIDRYENMGFRLLISI